MAGQRTYRARPVLGRAAAGLLAGAFLSCVGCSDQAGGDGSPPATLQYESPRAIEKDRAAKDLLFRTDADSPIPPDRRAAFKALDYYPFAPDLRFKVKLHRYPTPLPLTIVTTRGRERPARKVGYLEFQRGASRSRLQVYQLRDAPAGHQDELFLPFLDATSGGETYGAGRYIDLAPRPDGWFVLDFNRAYHPLCAYGRTDYRCPRTPEENRLPYPVQAGERGWAAHSETAEQPTPGTPGAGG